MNNGITQSDYAMFTKRGNRKVGNLVWKAISLPMHTSTTTLEEFLRDGMNEIYKTHKEVWDTAVREAIFATVDSMTGRKVSL